MHSERQQRGDAAGDMRPVIVFGAAGQLGEAMAARLADDGPLVALTRADVDLSDPQAVSRRVRDVAPRAIVNCTGYNQVDEAEEQAVAALETNAFVVRTLAHAARDVGATLVHYGSDFVFDGEARAPYVEDDRPNPRSVYAASKLLGEWFAADAPSHYVLRVESLFGGITRRKSSLDRIIELIAAGATARVFVDRVVSPSYVWDVADATAAMLRVMPAPGIYHCVNSGAATWHDVAAEVRRQLGTSAVLEGITMGDVRMRAARPRYCALSNQKLASVGIPMPTWQDALARALAARSAGVAGICDHAGS